MFGQNVDTEARMKEIQAIESIMAGLRATPDIGKSSEMEQFLSKILPSHRGEPEIALLKSMEDKMSGANALARALRRNPRVNRIEGGMEALFKSDTELAKSVMDVGTLTNFAQITGGQSLGYVSLDTRLARGTVRPNSFTLYMSLPKSAAFQVVDYWSYADDTGGPLPGAAFAGYSTVATGTLSTSAGLYNLNNVTLKLAVNGRALTTALAAQNSFVDIAAQETINAALAIMASLDWACYWGNPAFFANQFVGLASQIPAKNTFDFQAWYNTYAQTQGWTNAQTLFNMIYEVCGQISAYYQYGHITHAFMSPETAGSLQGLVTTLLNNIVNEFTESMVRNGIVVNGDLRGIKTRFGEVQFPIDLFISARDLPAQAVVYSNGSSPATATGPTPPQTLTVAVNAPSVSGSAWTTTYAPTGAGNAFYGYAVASCDASMNESQLIFSAPTSGVAANGAMTLSITGPAAADAAAFRIYRSGLGYQVAASGGVASAFRYIGTVLASGSGTVTFQDLNTHIPGSESIFLLDLDEQDLAVDYRYLLPLSKIDLFAQNLYMPWAVATIGALRLRIPKFHGLINNYVPDSPVWNPLGTNLSNL